MSSVQQGSSNPQMRNCNRHPQSERGCRRSWTPQEEAVLLASLKELVALGWKADNGFKTGYLPRLEEAISKEFPGTDLKGNPHITSKLQTWKKNYNSLTLMFARSGVGFQEDGSHVIDCNNEQWESIVKADCNAKTMRYKSWPLFEQWKEIFGKDRATGDAAQDVADMAKEMMHEDDEAENMHERDDVYRPNMENISADDQGENSTANNTKEEVVKQRTGKGKKRSRDDPIQGVADLLAEISRSTNDRLDTIAKAIGYEIGVDESTKESFRLLETTGLERDEKFEICEIFADKPERLLIFKGLPDDDRKPYLERLLNSKK